MAIEGVVDAFHRRLKELDHREPGLWFLAADDERAEELGRRAAEFVVAPLRWSAAVGERFDTSELADLLGVTRQAIASRVQAGSLLALPGRGTRWYPRWQVNIAERTVRPVVAELLRAWRQQEPDVDPLIVAAWATTPLDLLDDRAPSELIGKEVDNELVVCAAAATAEQRAR